MFAARNQFFIPPPAAGFSPPTLSGLNEADSATSVTIPTHAAGNLLLIWATYNISGFTPTPPGAGGTVPSWSLINNNSTNLGGALYSFVATASTTTTGTWNNTVAISATVITGQASGTTWRGGHSINSVNGTNPTTSAITLAQTDGSSLILEFHAEWITNTWAAAPSGYTNIYGVSGSPSTYQCIDTKNDSTSDGAIAHTYNGTKSGAVSAQLEVKSH